MKNLILYENFSRQREMILTSRQGREINLMIEGGRIIHIDNQSGVNFPWVVGQSYNRSIETWACNNGFKIDGESPCPEKKIFGLRAKDIPKGHELRLLYPSKFRD